jgi:transposase InsO family protein
MTKAQREIKLKLNVLNHAKTSKNVALTCRRFGISRQSFYTWKTNYEKYGEDGLINKAPIPKSHPATTPPDIQDIVIHMRKKYHFGPERISMYLQRYRPDIKISTLTIYRILRRNGLNRPPRKTTRRALNTKRYEKQVPGHHIQVDVKFLSFIDKDTRKIKRFQYTAIDDVTRIRAMKIYPKHNQRTAIEFIDYILETFPFRVHTIRTDNGHEFQAQFHWHVEDMGIRHVYIKPRTPRLNGKVERSHQTDDVEFYQLLTYVDDIDLNVKLTEWEKFYNFDRPHTSLKGKTPYEILREKLLQ